MQWDGLIPGLTWLLLSTVFVCLKVVSLSLAFLLEGDDSDKKTHTQIWPLIDSAGQEDGWGKTGISGIGAGVGPCFCSCSCSYSQGKITYLWQWFADWFGVTEFKDVYIESKYWPCIFAIENWWVIWHTRMSDVPLKCRLACCAIFFFN